MTDINLTRYIMGVALRNPGTEAYAIAQRVGLPYSDVCKRIDAMRKKGKLRPIKQHVLTDTGRRCDARLHDPDHVEISKHLLDVTRNLAEICERIKWSPNRVRSNLIEMVQLGLVCPRYAVFLHSDRIPPYNPLGSLWTRHEEVSKMLDGADDGACITISRRRPSGSERKVGGMYVRSGEDTNAAFARLMAGLLPDLPIGTPLRVWCGSPQSSMVVHVGKKVRAQTPKPEPKPQPKPEPKPKPKPKAQPPLLSVPSMPSSSKKNRPPSAGELVTLVEASKRIGRSVPTLRRWAAQGHLTKRKGPRAAGGRGSPLVLVDMDEVLLRADDLGLRTELPSTATPNDRAGLEAVKSAPMVEARLRQMIAAKDAEIRRLRRTLRAMLDDDATSMGDDEQ